MNGQRPASICTAGHLLPCKLLYITLQELITRNQMLQLCVVAKSFPPLNFSSDSVLGRDRLVSVVYQRPLSKIFFIKKKAFATPSLNRPFVNLRLAFIDWAPLSLSLSHCSGGAFSFFPFSSTTLSGSSSGSLISAFLLCVSQLIINHPLNRILKSITSMDQTTASNLGSLKTILV